MTLSDYIKSERGLAVLVAKRAGVAVSTVTRIAKGEVSPTRANAEAIAAATDGSVTVQEVYGFEAAA